MRLVIGHLHKYILKWNICTLLCVRTLNCQCRWDIIAVIVQLFMFRLVTDCRFSGIYIRAVHVGWPSPWLMDRQIPSLYITGYVFGIHLNSQSQQYCSAYPLNLCAYIGDICFPFNEINTVWSLIIYEFSSLKSIIYINQIVFSSLS
jgi:hypothetical protein